MQSLKVLISYDIPYPRFDGVSNLLRNLHGYFARNNLDVLLVCPRDKHCFQNKYPEYKTVRISGIRLPGYRDCNFALPQFGLDGIIDAFNPQLIHALAPFALGSSVIGFAKRKRIPIIGTFTTNIPEYVSYYKLGFLKPFAWKTFSIIHNNCDVNLAPSNSIKAEMEKHGVLRAAVWGRGVNAKSFNPAKRSEAFRALMTSGHTQRKVILYVGRLSQEKNIRQLFEATRREKNIHTVFVGDGPQRLNLERMFAGENVTFMGFLEGEKLYQAYASADIFVIPSLTEGFANVVLESFSSGVPVVGFRSNGVADLILESNAGLLANSQSSEDLRKAIFTLIEDPALHKELSLRARNYALSKSWKRCFDDLVTYYAKLVNHPVSRCYPAPQVGKLTDYVFTSSHND